MPLKRKIIIKKMAQKRKAEREKGVVSFNYIGFYVK